MRTGFRTKVFVASSPRPRCRCWRWPACCPGRFAASSAPRIEQRLADEARLIADLLSQAPRPRRPTRSTPKPIASGSSSRAASRSSPKTGASLATPRSLPTTLDTLENHASRPEVVAAREHGLRHAASATARRCIPTCCTSPFVRRTRWCATCAWPLPLTDVDEQLAAIRRAALTAMAVAIPLALIVAWVLSAPLARRVQAIASVARSLLGRRPHAADLRLRDRRARHGRARAR